MKLQRICLISPGHIASNPRLVKEANSLDAAGYSVRVVAGDYMAEVRPLDRTILAKADWSYTRVTIGSRIGHWRRRLLQEGAKAIARIGIPHSSIAIWAHSPMSVRLAQAAIREPADLYLAHCLAALPAAAIAAQYHQAKLGFDAEDFHLGELFNTPEYQSEMVVRDYLERTFLPQCDHLTAASPLIAEAYSKRYNIHPQTILNVFPLSDALPCSTLKGDRVDAMPSLYWFSQTIGAGRGIEAVIQAMGQMKTPVRLYLRGFLSAGYAEQLQTLAQTMGVGDRVHVFPPAPPDEMVRLASCHDVGLCLEQNEPFNRSLCLTNKIFVYLLAGLPLLMSRTPAQIELAGRLGKAAVLMNIQHPKEMAIALDTLFANTDSFHHARRVALSLGKTLYNWDREQQKFLQQIQRMFEHPATEKLFIH